MANVVARLKPVSYFWRAMNTRELLGFTIIPIGLLIAAIAINSLSLWSFLGNLTVPWLCTALAISLLIAGSTSLLSHCRLAEIPAPVAVLVVLGVALVVGIGLLVDLFAYELTEDWLATLGEWFGFLGILAGVFVIPRLAAKPSQV